MCLLQLFLTEAVCALQEARSILKYTYVFAFYLVKNNQVRGNYQVSSSPPFSIHILQCAIFEDNQQDLEMAVEQLSGYLEGGASAAKSIKPDYFIMLRQRVRLLFEVKFLTVVAFCLLFMCLSSRSYKF